MTHTITVPINLQEASPAVTGNFPARFILDRVFATNASESPQASDILLTIEGADGSLYVDGEDVTEFDLHAPEKVRCLFAQFAGFQSSVQSAPPVVTINGTATEPATLELIFEVIEVGAEQVGERNAGGGEIQPERP